MVSGCICDIYHSSLTVCIHWKKKNKFLMYIFFPHSILFSYSLLYEAAFKYNI